MTGRKHVPAAILVLLCLFLVGTTAWALPNNGIVRLTGSNTPKLDPAQGKDRTSTIAYVNIYDSLIFQDFEGKLTDGGVAQSWSVSKDGLVYTFKIRKGIKFHNGDVLSAEDVVFSMQRLLKINRGFAYLFADRVAEVTALDGQTVIMKLKEPFGPFLQTLTRLYIVNKKQVMQNLQDGTYGEYKDYGMNWLLNNDAGSGPYKLREIAHNQYLLTEKYPAYWQGFKPKNPNGFKLLAVSEPVTVRTMMLRGQLEFTDEYQPIETYQNLEKAKGVKLFAVSNGKMLYLSLNNTKAPTDDPHFRKALSYAINYDALMKIFPWRKHPKAPVAQSLIGAATDLPPYEYNPQKAKEELAKSAYAGSLEKQVVEIAWIGDVPDREKLALAIQADAAKVGINIEIVKVPWAKFVDQASRKEDTPNGATLTVGVHYGEAGTLLRSVYHSTSIGSYENMSWKSYPEVDALIDDALREPSQVRRIAKYQAAQKAIVENQPHIAVFEEPEIHAYQASYLVWEPAELDRAGKKIVPGLDLFYMRGIEYK